MPPLNLLLEHFIDHLMLLYNALPLKSTAHDIQPEHAATPAGDVLDLEADGVELFPQLEEDGTFGGGEVVGWFGGGGRLGF